MKIELMRDLAALAALAYEDPAEAEADSELLGMSGFTRFESDGTVVDIVSDDTRLVIAFRGTDDTDDVLYNARFSTEQGALGARVHSGFRMALKNVWGDVEPVILATDKNVLFTGHSLGGALALLAAARVLEMGRRVEGVVTFGQPRVGKGKFAREINLRMQSRVFRVINFVDPVPRVPLAIQGYRHAGRRWYYDDNGTLFEDALALRLVFDEWSFRVRNIRSAKVLGLKWHDKGRYRSIFDDEIAQNDSPNGLDTVSNP